MSRRISLIVALGVLLAITVACTNKKSVNPLAGVGSKQPDKVLFDKAMDAMKHNRFDVARMTLQTLINTYPDSEFIARAKLAVGDSWYAEGGTASLAQAEQEYRDFETFFPNMPEAAEAQLKIANIQYQQMEKSDRDYTHAKRAEDEYRNLIMQYPDNPKLVKAGSVGRPGVWDWEVLQYAAVVSGVDCAVAVAGGEISAVQPGRRSAVCVGPGL
jgi:outer membrane protein assembly factor BamD